MRRSSLVVTVSFMLVAVELIPVAHANPFKLKFQKSSQPPAQGQQPPASTTWPGASSSSGTGSNAGSATGANAAPTPASTATSTSPTTEALPKGAFGPDIVGLRIGMTLDEVKTVLAKTPGINGRLLNGTSLTVKDPELGTLSVGFGKSSMRLMMVARSAVPGMQNTPEGRNMLESQLSQKYGPPSATVSNIPGSAHPDYMNWYIDHQGRTLAIDCKRNLPPECRHAITLAVTLTNFSTVLRDGLFEQLEVEARQAENAKKNQQRRQQEEQNAATFKPKL